MKQVFVSYAHQDNEPPYSLDPKFGWVTYLVAELMRRVTEETGEKVHFKIDLQFTGNQDLSPQIQTAIDGSAVFLAIGSASYLKSEWCGKELAHFLRRTERDRVFIVEKKQYDRSKLAAPLTSLIGKKFWELDKPSGEVRTFGDPTPTAVNDASYQRMVNRLSQEIAALIQRPTNAPAVSERVVFLAESGSEELDEYRDSIRSYLLQHEVRVLTPERFSPEAQLYREELKTALKHSGIVYAQLVDERRGRRLASDASAGGSVPSEVRVVKWQYETACGQYVPMFLWRPDSIDLAKIADEAHRAMVAKAHTGSLEDFKELLLRRADSPAGRVVVSHHARDRHIAEQVLAEVRRKSFSANAVCPDDQPEQLKSKLGACVAYLLLHGDSDEDQLGTHFGHCVEAFLRRDLSPPRRALILGPPRPKPRGQVEPAWYQQPHRINCMDGIDPERISLFLDTFLDQLPRPQA